MQFDVAIVGGGIVGLATAYQIARRRPETRIAVLEKELLLAQHQSGHNSGVLHSGIYYRPGSLKAQTCRTGKRLMEEFCEQQGIPFETCGKVIVAVDESERTGLRALYERGQQNGVHCEWVEPQRLHELEPHVNGVAAIHIAESGIVDYRAVCRSLADKLTQNGTQLLLGRRVQGMREAANQVVIEVSDGEAVVADIAVNCAGLYCDRVARRSGAEPAVRILPFRGEYYRLRPAARPLCRNLIYPVPDPRFPFLGVHFTREISGEVECGPNAVLALAREGYRRRDVCFRDVAELLSYRGTWRMAARYWNVGCSEWWRSMSKRAFLRSLQRLIPSVQSDDLEQGPTGVRAQAVLPDGRFVDDFLVERNGRVIHVYNAPSPAATASLQIGNVIAEKTSGS